MTGLPVIDAAEHLASIDWASLPDPTIDDPGGIVADDGRRLIDADEIIAWFRAQRSAPLTRS
ncbi:hypothetical protein [Iamia sp.]|uniref:hypothetical protein n=1 Tax=Iamia sp. TaxID=2722710 RepID=UPI002BA8B498|nr:hypothetical protein [Iamia sp.]HXH57998.1 hypothetical protein [Iamia sp.]